MRYALIVVLASGCNLAVAGTPALTIYDQGFAVVSETVPLQLKAGLNEVTYSEMTGCADSDSVLLRAKPGGVEFRTVEQSYVDDPVSHNRLLGQMVGKTLDFLVVGEEGKQSLVSGRILRVGPSSRGNPGAVSLFADVLVEVDGKLCFGLPGKPMFPQLGPNMTLRPTVRWLLDAPKEGAVLADLSYVTSGIGWEASYNVVVPEGGDDLELAGWVKLVNVSGKTFEGAAIELMAAEGEGDAADRDVRARESIASMTRNLPMPHPVPPAENRHDNYKSFALHRPITINDQESKEVGYVYVTEIRSTTFYLYIPTQLDGGDRSRGEYGYAQQRPASGTKVWVMREFYNTEANHLGMPLPKGRLRFYRTAGANTELVSDRSIDCIPPQGTIQMFSGIADDITGGRRVTKQVQDHARGRVSEETYEIDLRSQKEEPVEVRVMEELKRGRHWTITDASDIYKKLNDHTVEFRVQVVPNEKRTITYTVRYESIG